MTMRIASDNTNRKAASIKQRAPQRSRSRRERRSDAARKPVLHVVMPGMEVARAEIKPRETITAFLRRVGWATKDKIYGWQFKKGLPTVLEINGECVLRKQWRTTRIAAADVVRFVSYPMGGSNGGGAKQVIGLVALIAVAAFSAVASAGLLASVLGPSFAVGTWGATGLALGIGLGGALLVNALQRKTSNVSDQRHPAEEGRAYSDRRIGLPNERNAIGHRAES
jgi:sulfur carrier protein ThiS